MGGFFVSSRQESDTPGAGIWMHGYDSEYWRSVLALFDCGSYEANYQQRQHAGKWDRDTRITIVIKCHAVIKKSANVYGATANVRSQDRGTSLVEVYQVGECIETPYPNDLETRIWVGLRDQMKLNPVICQSGNADCTSTDIGSQTPEDQRRGGSAHLGLLTGTPGHKPLSCTSVRNDRFLHFLSIDEAAWQRPARRNSAPTYLC